MGNQLLKAALEIASAVHRSGGSGFMEHPETPWWLDGQNAPSIWNTRAIQAFAALDRNTLFSFDQCTTGQIAKKPTTLLLSRLQRAATHLFKLGRLGRCTHPRGHHSLLCGRNRDGSWRTAPAKVYTTVLCGILRRSFVETLVRGLDHDFCYYDRAAIDSEIRKFLVSWDCYSTTTFQMGHDFFAQ